MIFIAVWINVIHEEKEGRVLKEFNMECESSQSLLPLHESSRYAADVSGYKRLSCEKGYYCIR
jgi:hypothetical protein